MAFLYFRSGTYEIQEADNVPLGTKIVVHLKPECREFADEDTVKSNYLRIFFSVSVIFKNN